ncbi:G-protein beta wd-40 repeats containing protein, partial [Globisporangium splendens]
MQVRGEASWQWKPKATVTAADSCRVCTALALEYADRTLVRVRRNPQFADSRPGRAAKGSEEPQVDDETELQGAHVPHEVELSSHLERVHLSGFQFVSCDLVLSVKRLIWDLAAKALLFQSSVLSAFAILSLATNPRTGDLSIGFADGTIRVFSLLGDFAKQIMVANIESFLRKLLWKKQRQEEIQGLLRESPNAISSLLPWARSEQSQEIAQIQAQMQAVTLTSPGAVCAGTSGSCSSNQCHESASASTNTSSSIASSIISVLPTGPPPQDSVLNLPSLAVVAGSKLLKKKAGKSLDKPITFHSRVKSSGYGASLPFGMGKRTSIQDRKTPASARSLKPPAVVDAFLKEYPMQCGMLQHFQQKHELPCSTLHNGAIHHIEFSHDAKWLATSGQDKVAQVCKLPFSRFRGETGSVFVGRDNAVRSIHWSHNNQMVVTTSRDKSARVWLADSDVASLTFHGVPPASTSPGKLKPSASAPATRSFKNNSSSAKKVTKQEIVDAMFFYMDKFIVSGCGNAIRLHQFELDELHARAQTKKAKKNDILVEENTSRKKKVAEWTMDAMQSLTALTCVNSSFLSSVIIAAGSDCSLRILDAAVGGKTLRLISDAHARAAHTIALPKASCFTSHLSNFYDLLLSSALNSTIHLWDIRADNCVMRFGEHVNRVHPLGVAFSPCMRYIATGSEDRTAYLHDIRTGRCLRKLTGHTDVVTCVAFNPLYPQLATSSYDGTIRFYSDADETIFMRMGSLYF